jgi:hypothetical protein
LTEEPSATHNIHHKQRMTNIGAFWDSDNTYRGADLSRVGNYPPEDCSDFLQ